MFEIRARNCEALMVAEVDKTQCGMKPEKSGAPTAGHLLRLGKQLNSSACSSKVSAEMLNMSQSRADYKIWSRLNTTNSVLHSVEGPMNVI